MGFGVFGFYVLLQGSPLRCGTELGRAPSPNTAPMGFDSKFPYIGFQLQLRRVSSSDGVELKGDYKNFSRFIYLYYVLNIEVFLLYDIF